MIDALVASGDARWLDDASTRARVVDARDLAALDDALTTRVEAYGLSGKVCTMDELASALGTDRERARAVAVFYRLHRRIQGARCPIEDDANIGHTGMRYV